MTVLALHCAGRSNGVAKLHGEVSREMWNWLWPGTPTDEVPIGHVTNGVHMQTWLGPDVVALLDRHMPADWRSRLIETDVLDQISAIPDDEFWHAHVAAKHRLVNFVRQRARQRSIRQGESPAVLEMIEKALDPNALISGLCPSFRHLQACHPHLPRHGAILTHRDGSRSAGADGFLRQGAPGRRLR